MSMSRRDEKKRSRAREWAQEEKKSYEPTAVRLPEGVEWAKLEVKNYTATWDFLPFIVGKGNPKADEGEPYFMRMYETHRVPALNGRSDPYVCAASAFGKRCAVCDWLRTKGGSADQKLVKEVRAKTRILWLVNDNPEDVTNPVKVFETGYYNKGKAAWIVAAVDSHWLPCAAFAVVNGYLFLNTMRAHIRPGTRCNPRKLVYEYLHFKRHEPPRAYFISHSRWFEVI